MHKVQARDQLCDGMLHLQARVHLKEIEFSSFVNQEFHSSGIRVARCFGHVNGNFAHTLAHFLINNRRWRFFQNFLMPPLDGALALAEMDNVSMFIGQDLHLNVPRVCDQFLNVNLAIAECSQRLAFRRFERRF